MRRFRAHALTVNQALDELGLGRTRFYELSASSFAAAAPRRAQHWSPARSGGNHRPPLPEGVAATLRKLLTATPPCSYSFAASEALRRPDFAIDRATVRRWALRQGLAPRGPRQKPHRPIRRWQVQQIGQLWQYDASPHRWFHGQERQPPLLEIMDDHSRLLPGARLYERENLPAHLDFLPAAFRAHGLPLALYVDDHSFFFTSTPEALTQLGWALRFYDVSLRYAPTPQAKGRGGGRE